MCKRKVITKLSKQVDVLIDEIHEMNRLSYAMLVLTANATGLKPDQSKDIINDLLEEYDERRKNK